VLLIASATVRFIALAILWVPIDLYYPKFQPAGKYLVTGWNTTRRQPPMRPVGCGNSLSAT